MTMGRIPASPDPIRQFQEEVARNIDALAKAHGLQRQSLQWLADSLEYRYSYNFNWLGRPIIQYPQDMVAMQELIWRIRPDLIIETGIAHGGSLILSASMLALLDYCDGLPASQPAEASQTARRVVGIDIDIRAHNREAIDAHPLSRKITLIEGSSISPDIAAEVRDQARRHSRIMVVLDSNHTHEHVLAELKLYGPLVSVDSYCVVFDTIIEQLPEGSFTDRPWSPGNSPMTAVQSFLSTLETEATAAADGKRLLFEVDSRIDAKLLISTAPRGYLRRVIEPATAP
jgi:cephalosporin hydroxylase